MPKTESPNRVTLRFQILIDGYQLVVLVVAYKQTYENTPSISRATPVKNITGTLRTTNYTQEYPLHAQGTPVGHDS